MIVGTFCTYEALEAWLGQAVDAMEKNPLKQKEANTLRMVMACLKDSGLMHQGVLYEVGYDLLKDIERP